MVPGLSPEAIRRLLPQPFDIAGSYQWASIAAETYPFRVRGRQVRVVNEDGLGLPGAFVFRRDADTPVAQPLRAGGGRVYATDADGYLQGRSDLAAGDQLLALWPAENFVVPYDATLYLVSEPSSAQGTYYQLGSNTIGPVETITVTTNSTATARLLLVFDLDISLEWDARGDVEFMRRLETAVRNSADILYDVTDGQVALGNVRVHQNGEFWEDADVVIYASNAIHPRATMGGVVKWTWGDRVRAPAGDDGFVLAPDVYVNGQIRMGPNWDPLALQAGDLEQDWWRAFAHELGHYLLFLPDNYLGVEDGLLKPTNCVGSLMTDAYDAERYGELLVGAEWVGDCLDTVGEQLLFGRWDWAQVTQNLPIRAPAEPCREGEPCRDQTLPMAVTRLCWAPDAADGCSDLDEFLAQQADAAAPLPARRFMILDAANESEFRLQAQAFLFNVAPVDPSDPGLGEQVTDIVALGATSSAGNSIMVRGARRGDRLCVFDWQSNPPNIGCDVIDAEASSVAVAPAPGWTPDIAVTPVNSTTLTVTMPLPATVAACDDLAAQVIPAYNSRFRVEAAVASDQMHAVAGPDAGADAEAGPVLCGVELRAPSAAAEGFVRVWHRRGPFAETAVTQYFLSPGWGPNQGGFSPSNPATWGPNQGGFSPTNNAGWGPNQGGFSPTNNGGWGPNQGGFSPTNSGGWGPNQGWFQPDEHPAGARISGFSRRTAAAGVRTRAVSADQHAGWGRIRRLQPTNTAAGPESGRFQPDNPPAGANSRTAEAPLASGDGRGPSSTCPTFWPAPARLAPGAAAAAGIAVVADARGAGLSLQRSLVG
ncbi:MAG: hypothetical protein H6644_21050 [Caldilineaceae bacterium]|nr:hypothetical protein [Caldilineaceae bacterium]